MEDIKMNKWEWMEFMQDAGYAVVKIETPEIMKVYNHTHDAKATTLETLCALLFGLWVVSCVAFLILYFNGAF